MGVCGKRVIWSLPRARRRDTRECHAYEFYPVAKNNMRGSGSNKFCLAVLAWEEARFRREQHGLI
jgi:hypothetical protein